MVRTYWVIFFLVLGCAKAGAQQEVQVIPHEESLMAQALEMAEALEEKDWPAVIERTYPPLVQLNGGERQLLLQAQRSDETLQQQGLSLQKAELSAPLQEMAVEDKLLAIVPIRLTFKGALGKLYSESSLMGISEDDGAHWTFISMAQVDMEQILRLFPNLPSAFVIPPKQVYQE